MYSTASSGHTLSATGLPEFTYWGSYVNFLVQCIAILKPSENGNDEEMSETEIIRRFTAMAESGLPNRPEAIQEYFAGEVDGDIVLSRIVNAVLVADPSIVKSLALPAGLEFTMEEERMIVEHMRRYRNQLWGVKKNKHDFTPLELS